MPTYIEKETESDTQLDKDINLFPIEVSKIEVQQSGQDKRWLQTVIKYAPVLVTASLATYLLVKSGEVGENQQAMDDHNIESSSKAIVESEKLKLNGTYLTEAISEEEIPQFMEEVSFLGMDHVVVVATRVQNDSCENGEFSWLDGYPNKIGVILDEAEKNDLKVIIGLTGTMSACPLNFYEEKHIPSIVKDINYSVEEIEAKWGKHPAFSAWYIKNEIMLGWENPQLPLDHYRKQVESIKAVSTKPVWASGYLTDIGNMAPEELATRVGMFLGTGIDRLMVQTSVGADAIGYGKHGLEEYFNTLNSQYGDKVSTVIEAFNGLTRENIVGGAYSPAMIAQITRQLEATREIENTNWIYEDHLSDPRLLAEYKAYLGIEGERIQPQYLWITSPDDRYADSGNELFDDITGNPKDFLDPEWMGIIGQAELLIDLGEIRQVNWLAFHVLNANYAGINFPSQMTLLESVDAVKWWLVDSWGREIEAADSEYVISNDEPLELTTRYLRVVFEQEGEWTFISEASIIGE